MQNLLLKWGKHAAAIVIFLVLVLVYFSPAVFDGKSVHNVDMTNAEGMGKSQMEEYEKTAKPGEFSEWSDAMFSGMPYVAGYGSPAPNLPGYDVIEKPVKGIGYHNAGIIFAALVCFYLLMCILGVNWWLAIAGSIAFAFASYNIILVLAGHITKAYVIAYMPLTLAGMALLFKRKYLWGGILFLLGVALSIGNFHIQITYYLMLLCLFIYIGYIIYKFKQKDFKELGIVSAIMAGSVILAVLPNTRSLYIQWDWGKSSIRGATELTTSATEGEKISSGLDKDYAFQWSYGRSELLTLLIPNAYGGSSTARLDSSSKTYQFLRSSGRQVGKDIYLPTYWGDKQFTHGPVYFGAGICFLFILGMFVIRNRMKWWLFAGALLLTFMALGRNMDWFNDILFHYLPLYNKFRTVEMSLVIPGLVVPIIAFWGMKEIINGDRDWNILKRSLIWSLAITGGLCLIVWLLPSMFLNFHSNYDIQMEGQPYYSALLEDREQMASSDAFRSLVFILLTAGLVFFFIKAKNKEKTGIIVCAGIAVLTLADLWTVDKRYLNDSSFIKQKPAELYKETVADKEILKDTDISYRVVNLNNPFQETTTSYYHHSIGGYHAVKLRRYQELIDYRLMKELNAIIGTFQNATSEEDIHKSLLNTPTLNMLDTRYIIYNPEQPPIVNPFAFGNVWFVKQVNMVDNADQEIAALNTINPMETAVVDKRFSEDLQGFVPQFDPNGTIKLENYRPNHLIYKSNASTEQLAVFSEIYYQPGWDATIDGKPASHFRADWTLRAMRIPSGEHTIEFDFRPKAYVAAVNIGVYSSFFILLLLIGAIGYSIWSAIKKKESL